MPGIFALKPSLGRVPIHPPYAGRVTGPMTRTVTDAALLMNVISQPDARDYMNLPPASIDFLQLDRDLKGLKLGFLPEIGAGTPADARRCAPRSRPRRRPLPMPARVSSR